MKPFSDAIPLRTHWGWHSLRTRVLLLILMWVAFGISGVWYSATRLFAQHVEQQYHDELTVHLQELAGLAIVAPDGSAAMARPLSDPRYLVPLSGFYWQVDVDDGATLRSASLTRGSLDQSVAQSSRIRHVVMNGPTGPTITYGFGRRTPQGGQIHYLIATDMRLLDQVTAGFKRELTVWLMALTLALITTGLAIVAFGFRPLDSLSAAISALRAGDRAALSGGFPSEIAPLVDDLNAYISHNSRVVDRGRVEAGNLAHSLRTPLAIIMDEAERLSQQPETAKSAEALMQQSQIMAQQVEFRMARARTAAGLGAPGAFCRLSEVLPPVLSALKRLHRDIAFTVSGMDNSEAFLPIDPIDCAELLSNLLDNAGKWAETAVEIAIAVNGQTSVTISDDGPGLSPSQMGKAFEIGTRFDPSKPGSGLGLAIARDIAETYGLGLQLFSRGPGERGLSARIFADAAPSQPV